MKDYIMMYNTKYDINMKKTNGAEIGKIVKIPVEKDIMKTIYDKNAYEHFGFHCSFQILNDHDGSECPAMVVDDSYQAEFYLKPQFFEAVAMHELGHYLNGDHVSGIEPAQAMKYRTEAIMNGKVYEMEALADCFAVKQVGKSAMINALDKIIKKRRMRNDLGMIQAIRELELRKGLIKRM